MLGQLTTEGRSNEPAATPRLMGMLALRDAAVTIDPMGCQNRIAGQIVARGGDYLRAA